MDEQTIDGSMRSFEQHVTKKGARVFIGEPTDYPEKLADVLSDLYEGIPELKRAWLALYFNSESALNGGFLIALDVSDDGVMAKIAMESAAVSSTISGLERSVDLVQFKESGISSYFLGKKPFFQRGGG